MSSQPQESRSLGRKLLWIITSTILILVLIAILLSIFGGGALGLTELDRSFDSLQTQIDANEQNLESLQSLVNSEFEAGAPREQQRNIENLLRESTALTSDVEALQSDLEMDSNVQTQRLDELESVLATAVSNAAVTEASYSEGLLSLQTDLNQANRRVDELGGQLDELQAELDNANTAVSQLETNYNENIVTPQEIQYSTALFRSWEMIARARLRLLENNFGLAQTDGEQALRIIDYLIENNEGEHPDNLRIIQTRLALALASLPAQPEQASQDLDTAWNEIDKLLIMATFPEEDTAVFLSTLPTTEAREASTPTPEPDN